MGHCCYSHSNPEINNDTAPKLRTLRNQSQSHTFVSPKMHTQKIDVLITRSEKIVLRENMIAQSIGTAIRLTFLYIFYFENNWQRFCEEIYKNNFLTKKVEQISMIANLLLTHRGSGLGLVVLLKDY